MQYIFINSHFNLLDRSTNTFTEVAFVSFISSETA